LSVSDRPIIAVSSLNMRWAQSFVTTRDADGAVRQQKNASASGFPVESPQNLQSSSIFPANGSQPRGRRRQKVL
jgi:hypothetical protein